MNFNISYFLSKYNTTALIAAIKGVEISIPSIPHKYPNTNNPKIIVTGCNLVVLESITGCNKLPSKNWITTITASVAIPVGIAFVIELEELNGRKKLPNDVKVVSLVKY